MISPPLAPRLHATRATLGFWISACLIAFVLSFGLGLVWSGKRADQQVWTTAMSRP